MCQKSQRLPTDWWLPPQYDCSFLLMTQLYIIWEMRCGGSCVKGITHGFWGSSRRLWLNMVSERRWLFSRRQWHHCATKWKSASVGFDIFNAKSQNHGWVESLTEVYSFIIHFDILLAFGFGHLLQSVLRHKLEPLENQRTTEKSKWNDFIVFRSILSLSNISHWLALTFKESFILQLLKLH